MIGMTQNNALSAYFIDDINQEVAFNQLAHKNIKQEHIEIEWLINKLFSDEAVIKAMEITNSLIHIDQMETIKLTQTHLQQIKRHIFDLTTLAGQANAAEFNLSTNAHGITQFKIGPYVISTIDENNRLTRKSTAQQNDNGDNEYGDSGNTGSGNNRNETHANPLTPIPHRYIISDTHFSRARSQALTAHPQNNQTQYPKTMLQALRIR
ncbi:hypothetical protein [Shewanella surugensis]|uniref:Uncharacterized protein n=1 Tax=Shewanella surugensis TaxID=212020 RepID=A0ABT0LJP3_9GAMM|nr:hypothetical protein [Shewanella surugensis]MCL1127341.1 hypothetical protein [Shewanella surugensis]